MPCIAMLKAISSLYKHRNRAPLKRCTIGYQLIIGAVFLLQTHFRSMQGSIDLTRSISTYMEHCLVSSNQKLVRLEQNLFVSYVVIVSNVFALPKPQR
jgi:hypothetical protein